MFRLRTASSRLAAARTAFAWLPLACLAVFASSAASAEPRAVIELFTSQGCSSCPPADKLMAEYSQDRSIIALSLPVDYWDYLGWKDTLALNGHTKRQRAYARARGDREVYTPQAVINGAAHAVGSDKPAIERAIRKTRERASTLAVPVTMAVTGDMMTVDISEANDGRITGEIWLCPMTRRVPVVIGRGENRGRTVTYNNVVRRWIKIGDWTGKAQKIDVPLKDFKTDNIDSAAVMVQSGVASAPKVVLGAAQIEFH
jgi:hypothetical protein